MRNSTELTILSTTIRQDAEERYCLNDCWASAGKPEEKKPSNWNDLLGTKALVEEIRQSGNLTFGGKRPLAVKKGGNAPGIWACKELVYAYAMWISPAFHLKVIRAFDAMVTGRFSQPNPKRVRRPAFDVAFKRCMNVLAFRSDLDDNQKMLAASRGTYELSGVNPMELMGCPSIPAPDQEVYFTPTQLGKKLGISAVRMNKLLAGAGLQIRTTGGWMQTDQGRPYGRMFDTTRRGGNGSQQQLKWTAATVEVVRHFAPSQA